ncbi:DUF4931 domain-containing protein [Effusibacillus lacus]|uniref:DUF4931 domain-containing protein n=1 Tax=Effusibacillus lacus TaxID=1348429 RepID=A0A292YLQ8_9BACL|nr:DUF4931 domain-containing protein [Effusibacillus lacus]TCS70803.1 uncharacterized protein DUF4931 [Effusibacillus lacus]GAX89400.1 DUF4931 domain-containing protein [Effusibacillus lacus]
MSLYTHLRFNSHIGRQKPESIRNRYTQCPFCAREQLDADGILAEQGPILLVKNKYPTLQDTFQTVLIETDECESELSLYSKEHLYKLLRFGVEKWLEMDATNDYKSVIFYKNHGPNSGGSIRHPHMQIVGLKHIDYREHVKEEHFEGVVIDRQDGVEFNLSTKPRIGFFEFNVIFERNGPLERMADYVQTAAHYVLNHFHKDCNSYNLFFYQVGKMLAVKAVPRFVTTPLYVGFSIPQVSNRLEDVVKQVQDLYFK